MSKRIIVLALLAVLTAAGCAVQRRKLETLREQGLGATLALSRTELEEERRVIAAPRRDTLTVTDPEGRQVILMKAVRDDESGQMVAHEVLDAAVITARFRNVAERHGRIDLRFEVIVPREMQDRRWQLRFYPDMFILEDSLRLEPVVITGDEYRRSQLRGYEQYNRFLAGIITDSTAFIDYRNLEIFIRRNLPELYKYRTDSSYVSDEEFSSYYGLHEREVVQHYTNTFAKTFNERKKARRPEMYSRYVKSPIVTEGIRIDSVILSTDNEIVYHYTQTISTRPRLRKVDIILSGDIWDGPRRIYTMGRSAPLTFYISSLSSFADETEHYLSRVIERRAEANSACYVDFPVGSAAVDPGMGNNAAELSRIKSNILELLENRTYEMDSIVIAASASPEGSRAANGALAGRRAASVASYFDAFIRHYRDSVRAGSFSVTVDGEGRERIARTDDFPDIRFRSRSNGENWEMLSLLVDQDTVLSAQEKRSYIRHLETGDPDERERLLSGEPYYRYLRETLYPRLRTVRFDFFLHRRGMVKDTVHTTELDTLYMRGVQHLKDREYAEALECLRDYRDYNTAIAYVSLDYNASAMAILQELPRTPQVSYMLALLHARNGDDQKAVQCYLDACRGDRSYVFRGNLDPEIYVLIQRYGLNREDGDELLQQ